MYIKYAVGEPTYQQNKFFRKQKWVLLYSRNQPHVSWYIISLIYPDSNKTLISYGSWKKSQQKRIKHAHKSRLEYKSIFE